MLSFPNCKPFIFLFFVGEYNLHSLCSSSSKQSTPQRNCNLLWNGYGYWANKITWVPLCPSSSEWHYPAREFGKTRRSVLWVFGDSVSSQFYHQVKFHPLCKRNFARCMYCLLYTSPSPRDKRQSRMPSSA